jgi:hypothetical protein
MIRPRDNPNPVSIGQSHDRITRLPGARSRVVDAIEIAEKCHGVVVIGIARAEKQGDSAATTGPGQGGDRSRLAIELLKVPLSEFRPSRRRGIVVEPPPQRHTGRDIFEPEIDRGRGLRQAPRPQTINQHPDSIVIRWRIVDAFHLKSSMRTFRGLHCRTIPRAAPGEKLRHTQKCPALDMPRPCLQCAIAAPGFLVSRPNHQAIQ